MSHTTIHALARAARARVERGLRGVAYGPTAGTRLAARFRRLLRDSGAEVQVLSEATRGGAWTVERVRASYLALAGDLTIRARQTGGES